MAGKNKKKGTVLYLTGRNEGKVARQIYDLIHTMYYELFTEIEIKVVTPDVAKLEHDRTVLIEALKKYAGKDLYVRPEDWNHMKMGGECEIKDCEMMYDYASDAIAESEGGINFIISDEITDQKEV